MRSTPRASHWGGNQTAAWPQVQGVGLHGRACGILPDKSCEVGPTENDLYDASRQLCLPQDCDGQLPVQRHMAQGQRQGDRGPGRALKLVNNLLIGGRDYTQLAERVDALLKRCQEAGMTLASNKVQVESKVIFASYIIDGNT